MESDINTDRWIDLPDVNPNPVLRCDPDGVIVFTNPAVSLLRTKLACSSVSELLPADHLERVNRCVHFGETATARKRLKDRMFTWSYHPSKLKGLINIYGHDITGYFAFERNGIQAVISQAALTALGLPVAVLDSRLNVLFCSQAAMDIVDASPSLSIVDGILSSRYPKATEQLRSGVSVGGDRDFMLRLPYQADGSELELILLPLPTADKTESVSAAVLYLQVQGGRQNLSVEVELIKRYELTEAEARLANCLVQGLTLQESATIFGIAIATARTQLKNVFRKTGTRRQSEFLIKILTGVAWRAARLRE